ncbi:uncharacterized protein [Vulpes vulpes]|uniref:Uncharacterized protein n=1 Tax=Vulpes vulpes TaxID=9627 RepID=A0ABM5A6J7_VULVU
MATSPFRHRHPSHSRCRGGSWLRVGRGALGEPGRRRPCPAPAPDASRVGFACAAGRRPQAVGAPPATCWRRQQHPGSPWFREDFRSGLPQGLETRPLEHTDPRSPLKSLPRLQLALRQRPCTFTASSLQPTQTCSSGRPGPASRCTSPQLQPHGSVLLVSPDQGFPSGARRGVAAGTGPRPAHLEPPVRVQRLKAPDPPEPRETTSPSRPRPSSHLLQKRGREPLAQACEEQHEPQALGGGQDHGCPGAAEAATAQARGAWETGNLDAGPQGSHTKGTGSGWARLHSQPRDWLPPRVFGSRWGGGGESWASGPPPHAGHHGHTGVV